MRASAALRAATCVLVSAFAVLTWQVVARGPLTGADLPVQGWVLHNGLDRSGPLWLALSGLGDVRVALPVVAVAAAVTWFRRRALRPLLLAAAGLAAFTVVLEVMKAAIGRSAPGTRNDAAFAGGAAFPSGHTFAATSIWGLAAWLAVLAAAGAASPAGGPDVAGRPGVSRYACLIAGGTAGLAPAVAMVRMDYHWVSDVAGGWLLGMIALLAVLAAAESGRARTQPSGRLLRRNHRRPGRDAFMPEPPRPGRSSPYGCASPATSRDRRAAGISPPRRAPAAR